MKKFCCCLSLLLCAALAAGAQGPKPRVQSQYEKGDNRTEVAANVLYMLNTPEQFVQLQLRGRYWGRRLLLPAEVVTLEFYSFSNEPKYRSERDRRLVAVADGRQIDLGQPVYKSAGADTAAQLLPKVARVGGKLVMESVVAFVEPEQVALLAAARAVELRLGALALPMDDVHRAIFREFVSHVIPSEGSVPEPGSGVEVVEAQLPPELKDAALNDTMRWLQSQLDKNGTTSREGRMTRLVPVSFSGCRIKYKFFLQPARLPSWDNSKFPPVSTEYRVDLADLSPDSVRAVTYEGSAYVYFRTRSGERKIWQGWDSLSDELGGFYSGATLTLNKSKAVPGITAALARAVKLCQPQ
jgi:hypothetical protein